jgi:MFS transporter, DHA3 family, macrolide efflux protein
MADALVRESGEGTAPASGFRTYVTIWFGQFVSLLGSGLSGFACGVYVYQLSDSVTQLAVAYGLFILPMIAFSPVAGSLVDRWGVRKALLVSNVGGVAASLGLAALLLADTLAVWHIYIFVAATSVVRALQMPAFESVVPLLVPKRHYGRANGLRLFATASGETIAPVAAGFLLLAIGLEGIVLLDFSSFAFAVLTLLFVRVPRAVRPQGAPEPAGTAEVGRGLSELLKAFGVAWRYLAERSGLAALIGFLAVISFSSGFVDLLHTPLVLAFTTADRLGTVLTIGGIGMLLGSLAMSAWGGPRRLVRGLLIFSFVLAVATVLGSVKPNVAMIAAAAFLFLGASVIISGLFQNLLQLKVDPRLMGRVMALKNILLLTPQFLGIVLAGPAVDLLFAPLVGRDEVRSGAVAALVGTGPGRGIALLLLLNGVLIAAAVVVAAANPRVRRLEDELPDMTPEDRPAATVPAPN